MVLFQMPASYKWILQLGDIQGGCLQAGPLDPKYRPLYARLPLGGIPSASEKQLVEMLCNVDGQNDAPSAWYRVFGQEVLQAGFVRSKYDSYLYFIRDEHGLYGILGAHVEKA